MGNKELAATIAKDLLVKLIENKERDSLRLASSRDRDDFIKNLGASYRLLIKEVEEALKD